MRAPDDARSRDAARASESASLLGRRDDDRDARRRRESDDDDARDARGASEGAGEGLRMNRRTMASAAMASLGMMAMMAAMGGRETTARANANANAALGKRSVRRVEGAAYEGTVLDLDEKTRDDLTRRYRAKETVARLGGARRDGALTELGASNPLLEGEAWNTASESERSRRVSRTHDVDSGALGDVPQFFKDEAENFKSSSIGFSSGAAASGAAASGAAAVGSGIVSTPIAGSGVDGAAALIAEGATCDAAMCPDKFQHVDPACANGGIGCVGDSGCRFCRVLGMEKQGGMNDIPDSMGLCDPCVCEHYGFSTGCAGMPTPEGLESTPTTAPVQATPTTAPVQATPTLEQSSTVVQAAPVQAAQAYDEFSDIPQAAPAQQFSSEPQVAEVTDEGLASSFLTASSTASAALGLTCNYNTCDSKILYLMYDKRCLTEGGQGCYADSACRFCKTDHQDPSISYEDGWETCTQCVCDHYGVTGCEQGGLPEVPMNPVEASSTAPVMPPVETQPTLESTAPVVQATDEYQDREYDNDHYGEQVEQPAQVEQPVLMEQPVLVEQPPQPPKANVDPNRFAAAGMGAMEESGPVEAIPADQRLTANGIEWIQTKFGSLQTCESRCAEVQKTCAEHVWPSTMNDFRDVISRTTSADGSGNIVACDEILLNDETQHCGGVSALSGRCFLSPSHGHLPASCTYAAAHADCTNICPCV